MPVSLLPVVVPVLLVGIPLLFLLKGWKAFLIALAVSMVLAGSAILSVFAPAWILEAKARGGDGEAMYELARWSENHISLLQQFLPWPGSPDTAAGFSWLEKSARRGYLPALYAMGVRLKHGDFVPMPDDWSGPGGNSFPQPARGQAWIDRAIKLGYQPTIEEQYFYWQQFRR